MSEDDAVLWTLAASEDRSAMGTRTASQAPTMRRRIRPLPTVRDATDVGAPGGDGAPVRR